jgi:hypothetical protein
MSIISALQTYIKTYSDLKTGAPVWVDYLGLTPTEYAIIPLPGARIVESFIDGSSIREYPFALQSTESTADDLERLETNGFFEAFADWLESQSESDVLPTLDSGQSAIKIEATGWGYLFEQGESETGIYNIQCMLQYEEEA